MAAMLSGRGALYFYAAPWIAVLDFTMFGDALRDLLDPRLRGVQAGGRPAVGEPS